MPIYEDIHFYFSSKQYLKVMIEISKDIKESSYDDVLGEILSYKDVDVMRSEKFLLLVGN